MRSMLQARHDSDAVQTKTAGTAVQEQKFVDNRSAAASQRDLAEMSNKSPRVSQKPALNDALHSGARAVAQRQQMNALFGEAVPPKADGVLATDPSPALSEAKHNHTGLPNQLKSGIESLSGMSMDHVRVHYNSDQPAQLQAFAYAQGSHIHVGPGQERHLPHEAWHVVQQAQGRVKPTIQTDVGAAVNDDPALEREADLMGEKAISHGKTDDVTQRRSNTAHGSSGNLVRSGSGADTATQLRSNGSVAQLQMDWQSVSRTLKDICDKHEMMAAYNSMWSSKEIKRISEEVGGLADTDSDNVRRRLVSHPDIVGLLMSYRMKLASKDGEAPAESLDLDENTGRIAEDAYEAKDIAEVYTAFRSLVFFHASVAAGAVRETGLDPDYGGKDGGLTGEKSLAGKRETNLAAAKKKVFVSRKFIEVKQYAEGVEKNIVMLIIPTAFQNLLELDPDSQFGVKGGDALKGTINENGYPNYWGYMYLINQVKSNAAKLHLPTIWAVLVKRNLIKP